MTDLLTTVVFDLGNVLLDWDPSRLFRQLIDDPDELDHFLTSVCNRAWHDHQDRGRSTDDATTELQAEFPEYAELIGAYYSRWPDMTTGELPATVDIVRELRDAGIRLVALTNWPAETFEPARDRFDFFPWFEGIVVSGQEGMAKPDADIFTRLFDRYGVDPRTAAYIDDTAAHVETARSLGMAGFVYSDAVTLRRDLAEVGLPVQSEIDIRSATVDDLNAINEIYNHYVLNSTATFDIEVTSAAARREWLDRHPATGPHRVLVATRNGETLGYATSGQFRAKPAYDATVEVSIYLAPTETGRGIGPLLYQRLFTELRSESVHRAVAAIAQPNPGSVRLHHRFAFREVGTLAEVGRKGGQWVDVLWMQRPVP